MSLRWGIASAGKISHDFVTALRALPANEHEVVAVAARQLSRAQEFAKLHKIKKWYDNYEKLASDSDIDIVYVGSINTQHFDIVMMMLEHGKHVLCEKPLTMNLKQTTKLIECAKAKKRFLMEAVWSRCFPLYDVIRKELESGSLGDIHQVIVNFGFNIADVARVNTKELGGGTILDLGVYCLQFACLIFNNEKPESIKAAGFLNEDGVDMSTSTTLLYKGNRTATLVTHAMVTPPNEAIVCGKKGMIKVPNFWCPTTVSLPSGIVNAPLPKSTQDETYNFINSAGLCYEAAEARKCILEGLIESPKVSHDTSLLLATLEDEIRKQLGVVYSQD